MGVVLVGEMAATRLTSDLSGLRVILHQSRQSECPYFDRDTDCYGAFNHHFPIIRYIMTINLILDSHI